MGAVAASCGWAMCHMWMRSPLGSVRSYSSVPLSGSENQRGLSRAGLKMAWRCHSSRDEQPPKAPPRPRTMASSARGRVRSRSIGDWTSQARRSFVSDGADEVPLAQLDAVVAQDVVRRRDVEVEVGQDDVGQVGDAVEGLSSPRIFIVTMRASAPSNCSGLKLSTYAMVFAMRAFRSSKVASLSSYFGGSSPVSRATAPFAKSPAMRTWVDSGNMSGKSRAPTSTAGSILRAAACAAPLSRTPSRLRRMRTNTGCRSAYIRLAMSSPYLFLLRFSMVPRQSAAPHRQA